MLLISAVLMILLSTGGFMVAELPIFMEWIGEINFFRYGILALLQNEMSGLTLKDTDGSKVDALDTLPHDLKTDLSIGELVGILIAFLVVIRSFAMLFLMKRAAKKTWADLFCCCLPRTESDSSSNPKSPVTQQSSFVTDGAELVPVGGAKPTDI